MNNQDKTKEQLIKELQELHKKNISLEALYNKGITERKRHSLATESFGFRRKI